MTYEKMFWLPDTLNSLMSKGYRITGSSDTITHRCHMKRCQHISGAIKEMMIISDSTRINRDRMGHNESSLLTAPMTKICAKKQNQLLNDLSTTYSIRQVGIYSN